MCEKIKESQDSLRRKKGRVGPSEAGDPGRGWITQLRKLRGKPESGFRQGLCWDLISTGLILAATCKRDGEGDNGNQDSA